MSEYRNRAPQTSKPDLIAAVDLLIIGGGINGTGIARDAVGRGLSVMLVEQEDLASHTSSASTKLIHGGLRYLEYGEFRLVRESLIERERLLAIAPHIIWPLAFVLPQFNAPRPAWLVRLGLFIYDHLGGRKRLPATYSVDLDHDPLGNGLVAAAGKAFVYADCWVEDSRLVALNAVDAAERGATISTRTRLVEAYREGGFWFATVMTEDGARIVRARALVNAAGPWVTQVLSCIVGAGSGREVRLIKGSHIVVPRLYQGDHAFMLQNPDRRVIFAIPYEGRFTLVGTTDEAWPGEPGRATISAGEIAYLLATINRYFVRRVTAEDVVWSYAGIRPLHEDHAAKASAVTRDYLLDLDAPYAQAPMLSIFGGKITTYRKLAEHALAQLADFFPSMTGPWTAAAALPGGDLVHGDVDRFVDELAGQRPGFPRELLRRLARAYGTRVMTLLGNAREPDDLGRDFGAGLRQAEIDYLVKHEWARCSEDILYRRSKLGLHVSAGAAEAIDEYLRLRVST